MTDHLRPVGGGDDGTMAVRGGVGGIRFQWEELEEASRVLGLLAVDAGRVAVALGVIERDVTELPWHALHLHTPDGAGRTLHELARADIDAAQESARHNERELRTTEDRVRAGLWAYRTADAAATAVTDAVREATAQTARGAARAAIAGGILDVGPLELRPGAAEERVPFDGSVEGVLARLAAVESEPPGSFEVLRAGSADAPVFVVVLPGTQSGLVDGRAGSNPFDVGGIAEALTEDSRHTEQAVREALVRAGAAEGDALVVAGYSQGGLHAVNVSGPEGLGSEYDVQLVITVGTPSGWDTPGGGEYLHLEHSTDAVPLLDLTANADARNRTTVSLGNPVPALEVGEDGTREPFGLGPAHKLENYADGARLVDASDAPSLAPAAAVLAVVGASGTARRYPFTAVRQSPPSAAGPTTVRPAVTAAPPSGTAAASRSRLWP